MKRFPRSLDKEEKAIIDSIKKGEWKPVEDIETFRSLLMKANPKPAKKKAISLRVSEDDLAILKLEAHKRGVKYQTLINSLLHQFALGHLKI